MKLKVFLLVISISVLVGYEGVQPPSFYAPYPTPWFTGSLLAPSGFVAGIGQMNVLPFLNTNVRVGRYDSHWKRRTRPNLYNLNVIAQVKVGILPRVDFQVSPFVDYKSIEGKHAGGFGDIPVNVNYQLYRPSTSYREGPAVKLGLKFNIPSGKYRNLNPDKERTDITGLGSWFPGPELSMSRLFHLWGIHFIEVRLGADYRFGTNVQVKGFSAYGGDATTRGRVHPGNFYRLITAAQYNFSQRWACACDFLYSHFDRDHFSGKTIEKVGSSSGERLSMAPAIEYNLSKNLGIIGGIWVSLAGRNTNQFVNGVLSMTASF